MKINRARYFLGFEGEKQKRYLFPNMGDFLFIRHCAPEQGFEIKKSHICSSQTGCIMLTFHTKILASIIKTGEQQP